MDPDSTESVTPLRREALAPSPARGGLGIVLVGAMAMVFALSSALMMVSTRGIDSCPSRARRVSAPPPVVERCAPSFEAAPNGATRARFEVCAPRAPLRAFAEE